MTGRERILAVLAGEKPDHVPFVPLIGRYYVRSLPGMGIPLEEIAPWERAATPVLREGLNMHEVETIRYLHADVLYRHVMAYRMKYADSVNPFSMEERGRMINGFTTPSGTIYEEITMSHGTDYRSKHMLRDRDDLLVFMDVLRASRPEPYYSEPREMDEFIGDDGIITLTGPVTPLQELLQFRMGVESTTYALMDYPDLMEELFAEIQALNLEIYRILAGAPSLVVITYEDTSTTVLGPEWYRKYCLYQLDEYADIIRDGGQHHIVHMCGKISRLTDEIAEGRMDGIDSVCPPNTGDLEPGEACSRTGKLIIGGLDPVELVHRDPAGCRVYAAGKLSQIPKGARFMLSTGDSTAAGTPVENLRAISALVRELA